MSYRNYSSRYNRSRNTYSGGSKSLQTGGTVYQKGGANFEVRKHSLRRYVELEPEQAVIIPLLHYHGDEPSGTNIDPDSKIVAQGTKVYHNTAVQDGSTVKNLHLEIQVQPKTLSSSAILDFYTGRVCTSFHDLAGDQIYGLKASTTDGKATFTDVASGHSDTDVSGSTGIDQTIPKMSLQKDTYDTGDVIKHWWKSMRKNVIYGGQPILYDAWEKVPAKAVRSNPGMFYGMIFMNDSTNISGDDTDVLKIEIKENFTEIPLVQ